MACVDCREVRHLLVVSFDELYLRTNDLVTAYIICSQLIYEYKPALNSNLNSLNSFSFYPSSPKILYAKSSKLLPVIQVSKLPIRLFVLDVIALITIVYYSGRVHLIQR